MWNDLDNDDDSMDNINENNKDIINDIEQKKSDNEDLFFPIDNPNKEKDFLNLDNIEKKVNEFLSKKQLYLVTYPETKQKNKPKKVDENKQKDKTGKSNSILKIKAALLQKVDSPRAKDFNFKFSPEQDYYFFIAKGVNDNYLNPIVTGTNKKKKVGKETTETKNEGTKDDKLENKRINLNFDYNKYILKAYIVYEKNGKLEVFHEEILNREICQVSHTTKENVEYYKNTKQMKVKKEKENFENFVSLTFEKYYLIEIEKKKPAAETIIKEDGILSVIYLITSEKKTAINLFTMVKYCLYFIKETLTNYIGKYIRDMIYDYCHLPSECFDDFLSHIGSVTKAADTFELVFPLKKYIKNIENLTMKNLISHVSRNLTNISRPKAQDKIPFHKFIFLYEKYKLYYEEKEFKIKQKYFLEDYKDSSKKKKYTKKYLFLQDCLIKDPVNDKISKENKVDLNMLLKIYFEILEKFLKEKLSPDREIIQDFLVKNLAKFLSQYSAFKGFINIDVVMNDDNNFEFQCSKNKKYNACINDNMHDFVVCLLKCINGLFGFNEGFFHKHFNIMDYSYNFNEKNVVHTFLTINDSSKKNRVRIYDIPFMDNWCYQIASLLMAIYRDNFGFLSNKDYLNKQKKSIDFHDNFKKLFRDIHKTVINDVLDNYEDVIPNFYEFCSKMSETPLDKYNCLDNLCQNFANKSIQYLLKNNVIFFCPYDIVFKNEISKFKFDLINEPRLDIILEPYLILVDKNLKEYLEKGEKKDNYLSEKHYNIKTFFQDLKSINIEKPHYTVFLTEQKNKEEEKDLDKEIDKDDIEDENENNLINSTPQEIDKDKEKEQSIERSESFSSNISEIPNLDKPIDINKVYPKRMHTLQMKKISKLKNLVPQFDFYFLFNLYYNYTYNTMKSLKLSFTDYDTLKRYIASIESSVTISFNDYDKTIMNKINPKKGEDNSKDAKILKKDVKKNIIKDLTIMAKLTRMTRHMNCIFSQYMKNVINEIIKGNKEVRDKINKNDGQEVPNIVNENNKKKNNYFMKIGHYLVNFRAYRNDYDSFEFFKKSEIKKKFESEEHYLKALE